VITNFLATDFPRVLEGAFEMSVGLQEVTRLAHHYEQFGPGELFAIVGSSGYFEISAGQASAAKLLGVATGGTGRAQGFLIATHAELPEGGSRLPQASQICGGAKIAQARIERRRITTPQDPAKVETLAAGRTIERIDRRGKNILVRFPAGSRCASTCA